MSFKYRSNQDNHDALIDMAAKGNLDAFNQLVLIYQNLTYNHAYALLGRSDLAEDAVQEGFLRVFQNMATFRGGSFRSWLLKIVTNCAYDFLRRSLRHPTQPLFRENENGDEIESPYWIADPAASVQNIVEQNELSKDLYRMMDELPNDYRSVLTLVDLYGLDYTEAAEALGVPLGTIKSRLARARLQMKKKLVSFGFQGTEFREPLIPELGTMEG